MDRRDAMALFVAVVDEGSFAAAARGCGVSAGVRGSRGAEAAGRDRRRRGRLPSPGGPVLVKPSATSPGVSPDSRS